MVESELISFLCGTCQKLQKISQSLSRPEIGAYHNQRARADIPIIFKFQKIELGIINYEILLRDGHFKAVDGYF